jgi:hypothetical protein
LDIIKVELKTPLDLMKLTENLKWTKDTLI